jgi:hypothetical protein
MLAFCDFTGFLLARSLRFWVARKQRRKGLVIAKQNGIEVYTGKNL